eukprot:9481086-Pyramimonas_sp.AAC.1
MQVSRANERPGRRKEGRMPGADWRPCAPYHVWNGVKERNSGPDSREGAAHHRLDDMSGHDAKGL